MKKVYFIILVLVQVLSVGVLVQAAERKISVEVDGVVVEFPDVGAQIVDGRTLVPIRGVFEALGFEVTWDSSTRTAFMRKGSDEVAISQQTAKILLNGQSVFSEVPPQNIDGRLMLPLRAIVEATGSGVEWDGLNSRVIVVSEPELVTESTPTPSPITTPTPTPEVETADVSPITAGAKSQRFIDIMSRDYTIKYNLYFSEFGDIGVQTQAVKGDKVATLSSMMGMQMRTIIEDGKYTMIMLDAGMYMIQDMPPEGNNTDFLNTMPDAVFIGSQTVGGYIVDEYDNGSGKIKMYMQRDTLVKIEFSSEIDGVSVSGYMDNIELLSGVDSLMFEIPEGFLMMQQ